MTTSIDNPILNSPYEQPDRHYVIGPQGQLGHVVTRWFLPDRQP